LFTLSSEQVFRSGLSLLLISLFGLVLSDLISEFPGSFEFIHAGLGSRVRVVNEFLPELGLPLQEIIA
jgi:hypothetical protein